MYEALFSEFKSNRDRLFLFSRKYDSLIEEVSNLYALLNESRDYVRDENIPIFDRRMSEERWVESTHQLYTSLERWKSSSMTPVSVGVMGRMSVGKTTVMMEMIDPPDESPIRKMPTRPQETTACAVRWGTPASLKERFQLNHDQILLKLGSTESPDEDLIVNIEGSEEVSPGHALSQPHLGLEVTAHPPQGRNLLLRTVRNESTVIQSKRPKSPSEKTLQEIAERSRLAVIPSASTHLKQTDDQIQSELVFLDFLDLVDFPGADAVNARAEVKDKAQSVFEANTHECDLMLFVIAPDAGSQNLGAQIKDIVWIHWSLRCILAGEQHYQRTLANAISSSYARLDNLSSLADFLDYESGEPLTANELADRLMEHMDDADEFWSWMSKQRALKNADLHKEFNFHLNQALSRNSELASVAIADERLAFLLNYGGKLLSGQYGFSRGADSSFWSAFVETTLNATTGAPEAFSKGIWPRFFLVDLPSSLIQSGLVYSDDIEIARKSLLACYHPESPYAVSKAEEAQLAIWLRLIKGEHVTDSTIQEFISQQRAEVFSEEACQFVREHPLMSLIHDLAQSWWWSSAFQRLPAEKRREIYQWTVESALGLVSVDSATGQPSGGYHLLRERLVLAASGIAFERKIKEASDRYEQALIRAQTLFSKIFRAQVGVAEVGRLARWGEACARWRYWKSGYGLIVTGRLSETIKSCRDMSLDEFKEVLISKSVETALTQMLYKEQSGLDGEDLKSFEAWLGNMLLSDMALNLYADSQLVQGRQQRPEHGLEFVRAIFLRLDVLMNWLNTNWRHERELTKAIGSMQIQEDLIVLKNALDQSRERQSFPFKLLSPATEEV